MESTNKQLSSMVHGANNTLNSDTDPVVLPKTTLTDKGLKFAPAEVRLKIFGFVFYDMNSGISERFREYPALLTALESDKELYEEAIEMYSKVVTFHADWSTDEGPLWDIVPTIRKLRIQFKNANYYGISMTMFNMGNLGTPSQNMLEILQNACNVSELTLDFPRAVFAKSLLEPGNVIIKTFPNATALHCTFEFRDDMRILPVYVFQEETLDFEEVVDQLDTGFGVEGKVEWGTSEEDFTPIGECVWRAKPGEFLRLKEVEDSELASKDAEDGS